MPVDSNMERRTLALLITCRDQLKQEHGIRVTIEKPLFDIGPKESKDGRHVCRPDFLLRFQKPDKSKHLVVVETMGYKTEEYRKNKHDMRRDFERVQGGSPPHAVIEHDRYQPGMNEDTIDRRFQEAVCKTIIEKFRQ